MRASDSDRTGKDRHDDLCKRRTLTKVGTDSGHRHTSKSLNPVSKADNELHVSSTPSHSVHSGAEVPLKAVRLSPLHLDPPRRRTEALVTTLTEVTPPSVLAARRSATEFRTPECFSAVAFETPGAKLNLKRTNRDVDLLHDDLDSESLSSSVVVAVRVRPFMPRSVLYPLWRHFGTGYWIIRPQTNLPTQICQHYMGCHETVSVNTTSGPSAPSATSLFAIAAAAARVYSLH